MTSACAGKSTAANRGCPKPARRSQTRRWRVLGLLGWVCTVAAIEARAAGPTLAVRSLAEGVELSWPLADGTYALETTLALGPAAAGQR